MIPSATKFTFARLRRCGAAVAMVLLFGSCSPKKVETYPDRLIQLIVPWAAGGGTDRVARFVADALQRRLGQPVIVVNKTGGSGAVGHSAGALAPPDGYTLTLGTFELSTMHSMGISKLTWEDFQPVAQLNGDAAAIFVRHDAPWKTLPELLDAIRAEQRKLKMSGTSTGGAWDLARTGLLLSQNIDPDKVIWAPTQGSAPALVELLGGHVDVVCCSVPEAASQVASGQVRVLAVLAPARLPDFPGHPTAREQGIEYEAVGWRGIMLPRKTPSAIADRLNMALSEIAASAEFQQFMKKNGFAVIVRGPDEFAKFLATEDAKWQAVIQRAGYDKLGRTNDPGPRAVPMLLAALLACATVVETIRSRRRVALPVVDAGSSSPAQWGTVLLVGTALILYVAMMPLAGFVASTAVFAAVVMWRLGSRWWVASLSACLLVVTIHLLFVKLFQVQLP